MTCDQATFMLERRWDKTLSAHEDRVLDEHIFGCSTCNSEALAIAAADRVFLQIPDCAPPMDIAAAVALRIADETPAEPNRAWFWGAVIAIAAIAAVVWRFGVPIPAALLGGPYYAAAQDVMKTFGSILGTWLRPVVSVIQSLAPATTALAPVLSVLAAVEMVVYGRWLMRRSGQGRTAGQV